MPLVKTVTSNNVIRGRDVLNSNLGTAYIEINGRMRRIFELRNISATVEMVKEDVMLINDVMCKHKCVAARGSGSFDDDSLVYQHAPRLVLHHHVRDVRPRKYAWAPQCHVVRLPHRPTRLGDVEHRKRHLVRRDGIHVRRVQH